MDPNEEAAAEESLITNGSIMNAQSQLFGKTQMFVCFVGWRFKKLPGHHS